MFQVKLKNDDLTTKILIDLKRRKDTSLSSTFTVPFVKGTDGNTYWIYKYLGKHWYVKIKVTSMRNSDL